MIRLSLSFDLRMQPAGKERPRVVKGHAFMPPAYEAWRQLFRWQVRSQVPASALLRVPLFGRLRFSATFSAPLGEMRPDLDNAIGAIWDAIQVPPRRLVKRKGKPPVLKGGGWGLILNDKQIKSIRDTEIVAGPTGIRFTIEELP